MKLRESTKSTLKYLSDLIEEKKIRDKDQVFVCEGKKIIDEALSKGYVPCAVYLTPDFLENHSLSREQFERHNADVYKISQAAYKKLSTLEHGQGVIAVFPRRRYAMEDFIKKSSYCFILGDKIQDPANVGGLIRLCAAFDADALILSEGSADVYNPKTIRASSGACFDVPCFYLSVEQILRQHKDNCRMYVASSKEHPSSRSISEIKALADKSMIVFGNEGQGADQRLIKNADQLFRIQISSRLESLNIVQSAAIALFYFKNIKS